MGGLKRLAVLILVTIGACLGAAAAQAAGEAELVVVGVPRDVYPEYVIDRDERSAGFVVDLMNPVAKRVGLRVNYRISPPGRRRWRRSSGATSISSRRRHYPGAC